MDFVNNRLKSNITGQKSRLFLGLFLSIVFLIISLDISKEITENNFIFAKIILLQLFFISFIILFNFIANEYSRNKLLSYIIIFFLTINIYFFGTIILTNMKDILLLTLGIIYLIATIVYIINAYITKLFNVKNINLNITNLILVFTTIFMLSSIVYQFFLFYIILIIFEIIFIKTNLDIIKQIINFRDEKTENIKNKPEI